MARRIAVLGAPGTGAALLAAQLREVLAPPSFCEITEQLEDEAAPDLALILGLDALPASISRAERLTCERIDTQIRQRLQALGHPYRVVYGTGSKRLNHALLALGLPAYDDEARLVREHAQFELNRGRTPWSCEKCSDPDCEHRLFTGLLRRA